MDNDVSAGSTTSTLGQLALGLTLLAFGLGHTGAIDNVGAADASSLATWVGGVALFVCGVLALRAGDGRTGTAFAGLGAFWFTWGSAAGTDVSAAAGGLFLLLFALLALTLTASAGGSGLLGQGVYGLLFLSLLLLGIGTFADMSALGKTAGWIAAVAGLAAGYGATAALARLAGAHRTRRTRQRARRELAGGSRTDEARRRSGARAGPRAAPVRGGTRRGPPAVSHTPAAASEPPPRARAPRLAPGRSAPSPSLSSPTGTVRLCCGQRAAPLAGASFPPRPACRSGPRVPRLAASPVPHRPSAPNAARRRPGRRVHLLRTPRAGLRACTGPRGFTCTSTQNTLSRSTSGGFRTMCLLRQVGRAAARGRPWTLAGPASGPYARAVDYSTVTDFARLRGLSMSRPRARAVWYANSWSGMPMRIGSSSSSFFGTTIVWSAFSCSWCATARILPLRALISSSAARFFSSRSSSGTIATVGMAGSMRASGPCLSSDAGYASAWM